MKRLLNLFKRRGSGSDQAMPEDKPLPAAGPDKPDYLDIVASGMEEAPWLVRRCLARVGSFTIQAGYVRVLDSESVRRYIVLPDLSGKKVEAAAWLLTLSVFACCTNMAGSG